MLLISNVILVSGAGTLLALGTGVTAELMSCPAKRRAANCELGWSRGGGLGGGGLGGLGGLGGGGGGGLRPAPEII